MTRKLIGRRREEEQKKNKVRDKRPSSLWTDRKGNWEYENILYEARSIRRNMVYDIRVEWIRIGPPRTVCLLV